MGDEGIANIDLPPTAIYRVDSTTRAEVDLQVATAKAYPRQLRRVINEATSMATASQDIAEGTIYSYRRGGKDITGPSVRLAEIMACAWGNLRCQTLLGDEGADFVSARGSAWDMERNVLVQAECRRSIRGRDGSRYSPDMIAVTQNAAASIALRNAIFRVVPRAFVDEVYSHAREAAVGNIKSISERRAKAFARFAAMGVSVDRVLARLGISDEREITLEHLEILIGVHNRLRDGEVLLESEFPEPEDAKKKDTVPAAPAPPADRNADLAAKVRGGAKAAPQVTVVVTKPPPGGTAGQAYPTPDDEPPPEDDVAF